MLSLSLAEWGAAFGALAVGSWVQSSAGLGLGLIAAPVLLLIEPGLVPGPLLGVALVLAALVTWRDRQGIDAEGFGAVLLGRLAGTVPGVLLVASLPERPLSFALGALVLLAVALSASGLRLAPSRRSLLAAGTLSGFMGTTAAIGGPPLALVYQHASGRRLRGTLSGHYVLGCALSLSGLALAGRFGKAELAAAAALLPGALLGFALSARTARLLDQGLARPAVLALSGVAGLVVILRQLL